MRIISSSYKIETEIDGESVLKNIERAGRTSYKSEDRITSESASSFVQMIISRGHYSVIEHVAVTVRIICDRGISHEIVRHRLASYTQESTRYCNYSEGKFGGEITVIKPAFWDLSKKEDSRKYGIWKRVIENIEKSYLDLIDSGASPQEARSILPNSLKTEIVVTMNLREWRHFFKLRTTEAAHPQMREISIPLLKDFKKLIPVVFDGILD